MRRILFFSVFICIAFAVFSQAPPRKCFGDVVPYSAKNISDEHILSFIAKGMFDSCVVFDTAGCRVQSMHYIGKDTLVKFSLAYLFVIPGVPEAVYKFGVVFENGLIKYTSDPFPPTIYKKDGLNIVSFESARQKAFETDKTLKENSSEVKGKFIRMNNSFVWHFSYQNKPTNNHGKSIYKSVMIDAYTGKPFWQ
jgi:hypothetical protein